MPMWTKSTPMSLTYPQLCLYLLLKEYLCHGRALIDYAFFPRDTKALVAVAPHDVERRSNDKSSQISLSNWGNIILMLPL